MTLGERYQLVKDYLDRIDLKFKFAPNFRSFSYTFTTILLFIFLTVSIYAQKEIRNIPITITLTNKSISEALWDVSKKSNVPIVYSNDFFSNIKYDFLFDNQTLENVINSILEETQTTYVIEDSQVIIVRKPKLYNISGYLEDSSTGERLIGANILVVGNNQGTITNKYGYFSIDIQDNNKVLRFSYLGYESLEKTFSNNIDQRLTITLSPNMTLQEVIVTDNDVKSNISQKSNNSSKLNKMEINKFSSLGGESDILRNIQQLTGVQSGTDGIGGMNVRGGNADQNLVLFDGVRIYNPYHALGLFSIFNSDIIKDVNFYKGAIPARYSGRASSVIDIRTKEGNNKLWKGEASVGLLASKLTIEGPLRKDKGAILLSGRRTHIDYFLKQLSKRQNAQQNKKGNYNYAFSDLVSKLNYTFTPKDRLYLTLYLGSDLYRNNSALKDEGFDEVSNQKLDWGNTLGVLRWNHLYGKKLFSNLTVNYSRFKFLSDNVYKFGISSDESFYFSEKSNFQSKVNDISSKIDFNYIPSQLHYIRYGLSARVVDFAPGQLSYSENAFIDFDESFPDSLQNTPSIRSQEYNAYIEDSWQIDPRLQIDYGLASNIMHTQGKTYVYWEPRLKLFWQTTPYVESHISASRMSQYFHVLTKSGSGLPNDIWIPSTSKIKPQSAWILDAGLATTISDFLKIKSQIYYKKIENLIDFRESNTAPEGIGIITANQWEDQVNTGKGTSYGIETSVIGNFKKNRILINYTWSNTERQFENINQGRPYPFLYDLRHVLGIHFYSNIHRDFTVSGSWNFRSGNNITLAQRHWEYNGIDSEAFQPVFVYGKKNGYKMPNFHQLDLRIEYNYANAWADYTFLLGVYNVYNRKNLSYLKTRTDPNTYNNKYVGVSFIPILPYFSIKANFPK